MIKYRTHTVRRCVLKVTYARCLSYAQTTQDTFIYPDISAARIVHVAGFMQRSGVRSSVCLSVPSIDSSSAARLVCCWARSPAADVDRQPVRAARAQQQMRVASLEVFFINDMRYINPRFTYLLTYLRRVESRGTRLNTDVCTFMLSTSAILYQIVDQ